LNKNIEFYSSISYTVIKDNQEPVQLKLHIGDIVDLNEESKGVAYAKINLLFNIKQTMVKFYTFFYLISFRWWTMLILYQDAHFIIIRSWKNHVGFESFQSIKLCIK
jgi:hypothetical protein